MLSLERVSRWVMYLGVLLALSIIPGGVGARGASALIAALFIAQYAALQAYRGYTKLPDTAETTADA